MRRAILSLAVVSLWGCGAPDAPLIAAEDAAAPVTPNYRVLEDESAITVSATQQGERFSGRFAGFDARIDFDADDLPGSAVYVRIPLAGLDLGNADRNDTLPGAAWFNTRLHPVATFRSDAIRRDGEGFVADGELTMKGLRRPVSLPFTLEQDTGRTLMRGQVVLDRTQWKLGEAPWDTQEWIGHDVEVDVLVVAEPL